MIYIKVGSVVYSEEDMRMKEMMNMEVDGIDTYTYVNVNNLNISPMLDEDGNETGQTTLRTKDGRVCAVIAETPEEFLSRLSATVVVPDSEIKVDDIRSN